MPKIFLLLEEWQLWNHHRWVLIYTVRWYSNTNIIETTLNLLPHESLSSSFFFWFEWWRERLQCVYPEVLVLFCWPACNYVFIHMFVLLSEFSWLPMFNLTIHRLPGLGTNFGARMDTILWYGLVYEYDNKKDTFWTKCD